ncbi:LOW QUALITY PROTEIN: hypothetical protein TorRG33x02_131910 [Trema orientale]|uniref:Uncharacterized protein n=1 Tax=Trema orientale TaxID=63057 RepID=A0A2P5EZL5_TREOI|nr:LOW QUALITY PROTEIN: hypothetical protein TorRG33x02_131910 [Trema orientale]
MVGSVITCGADGMFVLLQRPSRQPVWLDSGSCPQTAGFASSATDILSAAYVARSLAGDFTVLSFWLVLSMLSLLRGGTRKQTRLQGSGSTATLV